MQSQEWLHKLYAYLSERVSYQKFVKNKPIFLDQDGNAVSAFDDNGQLILFLPNDDIEGYTTVKKELLSEDATCEFIENFGVKNPSLRDEIYNKILPAYKTKKNIDKTSHFMKFFRYFKTCPNDQISEFIHLIKDKEFLCSTIDGDPKVDWDMGKFLYLPTPELKAWFETKPYTAFLCLDKYLEMVDEKDHSILMEFFDKLGVGKTPRVLCRQISSTELGRQTVSRVGKLKSHEYEDRYLDGCEQVIASINATRSVLLWHVLASTDQFHSLKGRHTWFYYSRQSEYFKSTEERRLLTAKWILNKSGELVSANTVTIQTLSEKYEIASVGAKSLIGFLGIRDEAQNTAHLSEEEARKIKLADEIEQSGLSQDELRAAIEDAKRKKIVHPSTGKGGSGSEGTSPKPTLIQEIEKRRPSVKHTNSSGHQENDPTPPPQPSDANEDADDYTPKAVDYGKKTGSRQRSLRQRA